MPTEHELAARLKQLKSGDADERATAAQKLAVLGEQPAAAVPLVAALDDADEQVREWVAAALESLGPPESCDLTKLVALLGAERSLQAYWAATLLGRLGPAAAEARGALEQVATAHVDPSVAKRAGWAIGRIESQDT